MRLNIILIVTLFVSSLYADNRTDDFKFLVNESINNKLKIDSESDNMYLFELGLCVLEANTISEVSSCDNINNVLLNYKTRLLGMLNESKYDIAKDNIKNRIKIINMWKENKLKD